MPQAYGGHPESGRDSSTPHRSGILVLTTALALAWVLIFLSGCEKKVTSSSLKRYSQVSPFSLTERSGISVSNQDLLGKIWVAHFFYSKCGSECRILGRRMESIQNRTKNDMDVMLVSMSVDPVSDTPDYLKYYAGEFNALDDKWYFLTGDKIEIYNVIIDSFLLPAAPELKSRDDLPRNFIHSEKFAVVDRQGFVRAYFDGMDRETPEKVLETIAVLKNEFTDPDSDTNPQ